MSLKVTLVRNTSERKVFTVQLMFMNDVFFQSALEVWANVPQLLRTNPTKLELASSLLPPRHSLFMKHTFTELKRKKNSNQTPLHNSWENEGYTCVTYCKLPPLAVDPKEQSGKKSI